ncbi:hypothetical protein GGR56DRAFT_679052 [Xylariaceae sp. FL0804]|nr:hypothetical protein GGR56DRAFT_679052 [Xylariaceae sp. FL0804]
MENPETKKFEKPPREKGSLASMTRMSAVTSTDTRQSTPDKEEQFVISSEESTILTRPVAYLPTIGTKNYYLGFGHPKPDTKTGRSRTYVDIVMTGTSKWLVNQRASTDVIIKVILKSILKRPARVVDGKPEKRIGYDLARFGLPKLSFGLIFEMLATRNSSVVTNGIVSTASYFWINAPLGVTDITESRTGLLH